MLTGLNVLLSVVPSAAGVGHVGRSARDLEVAQGAAGLGRHGVLALERRVGQRSQAGADARRPGSSIAELGCTQGTGSVAGGALRLVGLLAGLGFAATGGDLQFDCAHALQALGVPETAYCLNFSIARGLDYYTGTVYETTLTDHPQIGSICSGGRYEDLASHYSKSKLPGVGISIGLSRLFWQLREAGLIDGIEASSVQALVALMDEQGMPQSLDIARRLRAGGINTEVLMEPKKIGKQFQYAAKAGIRFVVLAGEDELARGVVAVKDLLREQQFEVSRDELASTLLVELEQSKAMV